MPNKLDALLYQWVLTEQEKESPLIFERLEELPEEQKISSLLAVHAQLVRDNDATCYDANVVAQAMTGHLAESLGKEFVEDAPDDVIDVINESEEFQEAMALVEDSTARLNLFEADFSKALLD